MVIAPIQWKQRMLRGCMVAFVIYALLNILAMVFYPVAPQWMKTG
jgi:hypothetical protein